MCRANLLLRRQGRLYKFGEDKGSKVTKKDRAYNDQRIRIYTKIFLGSKREILEMSFNDLWVVSHFFVHNDWKTIGKVLEEEFQCKLMLNPIFVDKALFKLMG